MHVKDKLAVLFLSQDVVKTSTLNTSFVYSWRKLKNDKQSDFVTVGLAAGFYWDVLMFVMCFVFLLVLRVFLLVNEFANVCLSDKICK